MTDTYQWERDSGSGFVDEAGETATTVVVPGGGTVLGDYYRARAYRDGVLIGESNVLGPITTNPGPTPPSSYTPNKTYSGGDFDAFLAGLVPGDVASIGAGLTPTVTAPITHGGISGNPIIVTSDDWGNVATIRGRLDMRGNGSWWEFDYLNFADSLSAFAPGHQQSWVIGGSDNIWRRCDFTNGNTKIGFEFINDSTYGVAHRNTIDRCHIHAIGRLPYGSTNNDHGIYDIGYNLHIVDTLIEDCSDRGYQCRGGKNALMEFSKISHCGEGVIFGDLGAVGSQLTKCVLINNVVTSRYLIETYDPSHLNSGNTVNDCYAWNADSRYPGGSGPGLTVTNLHNSDPTGVSGYGPRVTPGPV